MGKLFMVRCPECGHEFQQFNGVGMMGFAAGERKSDDDKFTCPECGHVFDPTEKGFGKCVIAEGLWD